MLAIKDRRSRPNCNFERDILALAREFSLVVEGTSLLLLETVEQYLKFEIHPPAHLRDLAAQYDLAISSRVKPPEKSEILQELYQNRLDW